MSRNHRKVYLNPSAKTWIAPQIPDPEPITRFHRNLPDFQSTPLIPLDSIAAEIGVRKVYVKNETSRLGLPAFKILGASWASFRAVVEKLQLPHDSHMEDVKRALKKNPITLYAATEGNHGRAVARMASILGVGAVVYVPSSMCQGTIANIEIEAAKVVQVKDNYDGAVDAARIAAAQDCTSILLQDTAFEGYEDIPKWIVEGYMTMLSEIDAEIESPGPDFVICPVGVGSLAQAVVSYYKQQGKPTAVVTAEPDTAACLWKSLVRGESITTHTTSTIMAGMNCGTVSSIAWPLLRAGVDASITVSDYEAHLSTTDLGSMGISTGPCGAAPLAALRRLSAEDKTKLGMTKDSVVVLLCTEAARVYNTPRDVSSNDAVRLTQDLVQINSASPNLGSVPGPGELAIANFIATWLEHRDIECHWIEPTPGRPSVVGIVRGTGGGKSLMLNGHIDTVTLSGYNDDPLSGEIRDGKLYGRGAADMKGGVAAQMIALANAKSLNLKGDVIFAGVADEEAESIGTEQILQAGWRADAAIVSEPTNEQIFHAHKGYTWVEVDVHGNAAHGSLPDVGVDAICKAGYFLVELDKYSRQLQQSSGNPILGPRSFHASIIKGGEEVSSYPALCTISLESRSIPGDTPASIEALIRNLLDNVAHHDPQFKYDIRTTFSRSQFSISPDHPFTTLVRKHVSQAVGMDASCYGAPFWTDCALLADAGIAPLLWGPVGGGLHASEEWVDVESVRRVAETITAVAAEFCK